jgi:cell division protein FtsB
MKSNQSKKSILFPAVLFLAVFLFYKYSMIVDKQKNRHQELDQRVAKQEQEINSLKNKLENQNKVIEELNSKVIKNSNSLTEKDKITEKKISQLKANANKEKLCNQVDILYNTVPPKDEDDCGIAFAENIEEMYKDMKDKYEHTPKECEENYYKKVKKAYEEYIVAKNKCESF